MNFSFSNRATSQANSQQVKQIKQWVYQAFMLYDDIPISLSQLQCHEPDCPPIETVITLMTQPPKQYKIHKPIAKIEYEDIVNLLK